MGRPNGAPAQRDRREQNLLQRQLLKRRRRSDDVADRIDRPDLVEMHLIDAALVHLGLGLCEVSEDLRSVPLYRLAEGAALDYVKHLCETAVRFGAIELHGDLRRCYARPRNLLGREPVTRYLQSCKRVPYEIQRDSGIHQRPQAHVAAYAAETVQVADPHGCPLLKKSRPSGCRTTGLNITRNTRAEVNGRRAPADEMHGWGDFHRDTHIDYVNLTEEILSGVGGPEVSH